MATVVIDDLFGGPARRVGIAPGEVVAAPPAPKRRNVTSTQREGHARIKREGPTIDERIALDIKGNGKLGRTRQEIADRTGIKLQTVCGAVNRLIKKGKLFEPVVGFDASHRAVHYRRDGRTVVVAELYRTFDWLSLGQHPHG